MIELEKPSVILREALEDYIATQGEYPTENETRYFEAGFMQGYTLALKRIINDLNITTHEQE